MTDGAQQIETAPKTQQQLFYELAVDRKVADLAKQQVENKMREIAKELSPTFKNEGFCPDYPSAPFLQIRVRMNKKAGRKVPYFVPLQRAPVESVGKAARARRAEATASEPKVAGSALMQITEPITSSVVALASFEAQDVQVTPSDPVGTPVLSPFETPTIPTVLENDESGILE